MIEPGMHLSEVARLLVLRDLAILDTPAEVEFDGHVQTVASLTGSAICVVSLVDAQRQWFKARIGMAASETPRSIAFCAHAILVPEGHALVVADAMNDPRFADNPQVTGETRVRVYFGLPLNIHGLPIGTLSIIDHVPRQASPALIEDMQRLGRQVERLLETRRIHGIRLLHSSAPQSTGSDRQTIFSVLDTGIVIQEHEGRIIDHNQAAERILGLSSKQMLGGLSVDARWASVRESGELFRGDEPPSMATLRTGRPCSGVIMGIKRPDGTQAWISINSVPVPRSSPTAGAVLASFADITAERNRRFEVERSQEALRDQKVVAESMRVSAEHHR
jgi:PAS domain S-box-containing protein